MENNLKLKVYHYHLNWQRTEERMLKLNAVQLSPLGFSHVKCDAVKLCLSAFYMEDPTINCEMLCGVFPDCFSGPKNMGKGKGNPKFCLKQKHQRLSVTTTPSSGSGCASIGTCAPLEGTQYGTTMCLCECMPCCPGPSSRRAHRSWLL